jgi:Protein of unknown function (DUF3263)
MLLGRLAPPFPVGCLTSTGVGGNLPPMGLTERDRAILDFERSWWNEPGSKTAAIRERLQLSPARYYELLARLIVSGEAAAYDPLLIHRLRRLQARRRRARIEGRWVAQPPGR